MKTKKQYRAEVAALNELLADLTEKSEALLVVAQGLVDNRYALEKSVFTYAKQASDLSYENMDLRERVNSLLEENQDLTELLAEYDADADDEDDADELANLRFDQGSTEYNPMEVPFA